MKLFWCSKCELWSNCGIVNVEVSCEFAGKKGNVWIAEDTGDICERSFTMGDIIRSECPECGGVMELQEIEKCPHRWGWSHHKHRLCDFCGERQDARLQWPDEIGG